MRDNERGDQRTGTGFTRPLTEDVLQNAHQAVASSAVPGPERPEATTAPAAAADGRGTDDRPATAWGITARGLLEEGTGLVDDLAAGLKSATQRAVDSTGRYVSERPLQAMLIAAGAGAVLAGLCVAATRRHHG